MERDVGRRGANNLSNEKEFSGLILHCLSSQFCFRFAYHVKGNVLPGLDKTLNQNSALLIAL